MQMMKCKTETGAVSLHYRNYNSKPFGFKHKSSIRGLKKQLLKEADNLTNTK